MRPGNWLYQTQKPPSEAISVSTLQRPVLIFSRGNRDTQKVICVRYQKHSTPYISQPSSNNAA